MKTLSELLKSITPLPWKRDKYGKPVDGRKPRLRSTICLTEFSLAMGGSEESKANDNYVFHAAQVLPQLIAAVNSDMQARLDFELYKSVYEKAKNKNNKEIMDSAAFVKSKTNNALVSALSRAENVE